MLVSVYYLTSELTDDLQVVEWGDCLPDCPTQEINPVCMNDPIAPALKTTEYPESKNYTTEFIFY